MNKTITIIIFLFCLNVLSSYGQVQFTCDYKKKGTKRITHVIDTNSYGFKEIEHDFFNPDGLKTKTELIYDSLLIQIDTFIYNSENRLVRRETLDPVSRQSYQHSTFLYDKNGSNFRTLISSISMKRGDSIILDTNYHHIRYDFIRDSLERFTERRTYFSMKKIADFDTSKFDITYQTWEGDTIVYVEDHYAGRTEYFKKSYRDCRLIKTEFLDNKGEVITLYKYDYIKFDKKGNWQVKHIYRTEEGQRELINIHRQEIELY